MAHEYPGSNRREFFRYKHETPIHFNVIKSADQSTVERIMDAVSRNVSASGILFSSASLPAISSILILDLDYRTTRICKEIEENALIIKDKVVGKVVRIEDSEDGRYNVGVAFIKKSDTLPREMLNIVA